MVLFEKLEKNSKTVPQIQIDAKNGKNHISTLYSFIFVHKNVIFSRWPFFSLLWHGITHMSGVTFDMSHVTYHLWHVTCHVTQFLFTFFLFLHIVWVSWWRVCYQWGLPLLVFGVLLIQNAMIPIFFISGLLVVRFGS